MGKITTLGESNRKPQRKKRGTIQERLTEKCQSQYLQIINNIEKIRIDKGMSKRDLSEAAGINENHYGHYINFRNEPKFGNILLLCEALKMTISEVEQYHLPEITDTTKQKIDDIHHTVIQLLRLSQNR